MPEQIDDVELAMSEACANVLDHAGAGEGYAISMFIGADSCSLKVVDNGNGFDHGDAHNRRVGPEAERGRGLTLMGALMDRMEFEAAPNRGTLVTLVKLVEFEARSAGERLLAGADWDRPRAAPSADQS